jgi:hypothetical protein
MPVAGFKPQYQQASGLRRRGHLHRQLRLYSDTINNEWVNDVEESGRGLSQVVSRLLLGATKENHKSQNILPPSPDSNPGYP